MFELYHFDPKLKRFAPGKICQRILLPVKQVMRQCRALTELVSTQMSQLGCRPRVKPLPRGTSAALRWPWTPGSRISQRDTKDSLGNRSFQKTQQVAHGFPTKKHKNPGEFRVFNMIRIEKVRWNGIDLCEFFRGDIGWPIRDLLFKSNKPSILWL